MSFGDYTFISQAGATVATWESISPIEGSHSWAAETVANETLTFGAGLTAGISAECGTVSILMKRTSQGDSPGISLGCHWGLFANMQSSLAVGSNAYCCIYFPEFNRLVISKQSPVLALADSTGMVNATFSGATQTLEGVYAMQLNWQLVPASSNIVLTASFGGPVANPNTYDASTFPWVAVCSVTDASATYTSGITSGWIGTMNGRGDGGRVRMYYDVFDIFTD